MKEIFGTRPINQLPSAQLIANRQATLNLILILALIAGITTVHAIKMNRELNNFKRKQKKGEKPM